MSTVTRLFFRSRKKLNLCFVAGKSIRKRASNGICSFRRGLFYGYFMLIDLVWIIFSLSCYLFKILWFILSSRVNIHNVSWDVLWFFFIVLWRSWETFDDVTCGHFMREYSYLMCRMEITKSSLMCCSKSDDATVQNARYRNGQRNSTCFQDK